jgi:hypothetical protein
MVVTSAQINEYQDLVYDFKRISNMLEAFYEKESLEQFKIDKENSKPKVEAYE